MHVARMRRGWRLRLTDNEFELLRAVVNRGLGTLEPDHVEAWPHKICKILYSSQRWSLPHGPLSLDEDRREA